MTGTADKSQPTPKAGAAPNAPAKPAAANVAVKAAASPIASTPAPVEKPSPVASASAVKPVAVKEADTKADTTASPVKKQAPAALPPVVKPVAKKPAPRAKAVAAPKRPTAKPATILKEPKMAETINTVTDKAQAYFADANARAKGALEKGVKAIEEANAFHKGNLEAIVESSKIAAKGAEKLGQDAAAYAKNSYEKANEAFKAMSGVKSPTDLFKLQSDYVRASFDAFVAETSRSTEAALKLAGEIAQPLSNRFALAAEKVKAVA